MSSAIHKGLPMLVSVRFREEEQGQGIRSIVEATFSNGRERQPLRTFSAKMFLEKHLSRNFPLEKALITQELEGAGGKKEAGEPERRGQFDLWSAIHQSHKAMDSNSSVLAPYVHPLVKRSASFLSQKSLEICTESLGSETGSDDFPSSDDLDRPVSQEDEDDNEEVFQFQHPKDIGKANYNLSIRQKSPARSFPPPLPSLSLRNGPSLHMIPYRKDGRLVLKAVPVPSHTDFHAQRDSGRLILTFVSPPPTHEEKSQTKQNNVDENKAFKQIENCPKEKDEQQELPKKKSQGEMAFYRKEVKEFDAKENEVLNKQIVIKVQVSEEDKSKVVFMKVHQSASMINCRQPKNPNPFEGTSSKETEESNKVVHSISDDFNGYDSFWKNMNSSNEHLIGRAPNFLLVKGCKEAPRPVFITKPRYIAAS